MAFNGYKLNYPTTKVVLNQDNDDVQSILTDDKSSWVLFSPDSDILSSITQDNGTDDESVHYSEGTNDEEQDIQHEQTPQRSQLHVNMEKTVEEEGEDTDTDTDSLIDNLDPSQLRIERLFNKSYNSITNWNLNNVQVDDNVASWDLDADLSHQSLDTSIIRLKQFYGDELIKNLNKQDLRNFKKIHHNLRPYLNTKTLTPILTQLISNLNVQNIPNPPQLSYNKYLKKTINSYYDYDELTSETASSSLILCGGDSWGEI